MAQRVIKVVNKDTGDVLAVRHTHTVDNSHTKVFS